METTRTITYDERSSGLKVLRLPADLPFSDELPGLLERLPAPADREGFARIAAERSVHGRASGLAGLIAGSGDPLETLLRVAALAADGQDIGIRLLYAALLAVPPIEEIVGEMARFDNVLKVMSRLRKSRESGATIRESEEWFEKKVRLLSTARPLPGDEAAAVEEPWLAWEAGVRRALADPDRRWDEAIRERVATELQAAQLRIRRIVASLDPDLHASTMRALLAISEELSWTAQIVAAGDGGGGSPLFLRRELEGIWDGLMDRLAEESGCPPLASLFAAQERKVHSFPRLRTGTAILRSILMHPLLRRTSIAPDVPSCLALFVESSGGGGLEFVVGPGKKLDAFLDVPGFSVEDRLLRVDLGAVPGPAFVAENETPVDVDWVEVGRGVDVSYKSLVLAHIDDDTFLAELLNNPKATKKPGVIPIIALRCRSSHILGIIANRRDFYTGFLNKEVPYNLLVNPARVSLTSLRKFIHVRYVDRMTLQRLATRSGQIREEVRREIVRFLSDR
ncbi:MAG: hypothetical protein JW876_07605 [Candidatus Krumholzibacteriota bacterium]|nr:hypothetical protein [Candidatus Krumholzibacteriota bacterium]